MCLLLICIVNSGKVSGKLEKLSLRAKIQESGRHTRSVVGHSRLNQRVSDWFHTLPLIEEPVCVRIRALEYPRIRQIRDTPAWARTLNSRWVNSNFSIVHTCVLCPRTRTHTPSHFEGDCVTMQNAYRCS